MEDLDTLLSEINGCQICLDRFHQTHSAHDPRPILRISKTARILIAGQAPGMRVYKSGEPFDDPSGERLREWMGVTRDIFYDQSKINILPMGFCFPGYNAAGSDLPPPKICAKTWRARVLEQIPQVDLILLIGGYAMDWHLGKGKVNERVRAWQDAPKGIIPLPHPSWRNTSWLRKNPWFEEEVLPVLRQEIRDRL